MNTLFTSKSLRLAGMSLLASIPLAQAQTLIDVSFPDGTGTNPLFLEIDNEVGEDNVWIQDSGVLSSSLTINSTIAAASNLLVDFTALGSDSLTLDIDVESLDGSIIANGIFIGFQRRVNDGERGDLWNNLPISFGLVIPGSNSVLNGTRSVGIGGNAGSGRYIASDFGTASLASLEDGFSLRLVVSSAGWEVEITGLEVSTVTPITGGSGSWGADGANPFADFPNDMRVGASYQTTSDGGDLTLSNVTLVQGPATQPLLEISSIEVDLEGDNPGSTLTWASVPGVEYSIDYSTDLVDWFEITDGEFSNGSSLTFTHELLPNFADLVEAPRLFYRIRLD